MGKVAADVGPVGTLINVAGWDRFVPFVDTTPEFWDRVIDINYRGTLNTVHAVLPGDDRAAARPDRVGRLRRGPGRLLVGVRSTPAPRAR